MDDNMKRKPRAISARPAVRPPGGSGAAASAAVAPGPQPGTQPLADSMQVIEGGGAKSGPNVKTYIERQLKSVYDDVLNQPIPDRFLDLLNTLETRVEQGANAKKEGQE